MCRAALEEFVCEVVDELADWNHLEVRRMYISKILIAEITQKKLISSKILYFIQGHFNAIQMNTVCMEYSSTYCSGFGEMDFYVLQ